MRFEGAARGFGPPGAIEVMTDVTDGRTIALRIHGRGVENGSLDLDENHAVALALALQAAVAEIQARAVGR